MTLQLQSHVVHQVAVQNRLMLNAFDYITTETTQQCKCGGEVLLKYEAISTHQQPQIRDSGEALLCPILHVLRGSHLNSYIGKVLTQ